MHVIKKRNERGRKRGGTCLPIPAHRHVPTQQKPFTPSTQPPHSEQGCPRHVPVPRSSPAVAMLWLVPAAPAQLSSEGVNSQQLLPRCRFWNSHLCNNKPRGKAVVMGGGGSLCPPPLAPALQASGCQVGRLGEGQQPRCCGIPSDRLTGG